MRGGRCGVMADGAVVRTLPAILTLLTVLACAQGRQPSFQGLGDLPGWDYESKATAISGDGLVVVGYSRSDRGEEAFRWTEAEGMVALAPAGSALPNGWYLTHAVAVSAEGSVIVGNYKEPNEDAGAGYRAQPFRWTAGEGMVTLSGMPDSMYVYAEDISADGSVLAGTAYDGIAFRWTAETGAIGLGDLDGHTRSFARAVSADGNVIGGYSSGDTNEGWRWTGEGAFEGIGNLRGEGFDSYARGISADGTTLVGSSDVAAADGSTAPEAFRWTPEEGMAGLRDLPGGRHSSSASDVSRDGSVIVGWSISDLGNEAFVWDETHGMRALRDVLLNDHGIDMSAWRLTRATGISDDGTVIVGYGDNPDGDVEAWVAVIPEPSALFFLASCIPLLVLRKGRGA